jgi:hypothetical protein
MSSAVEAHVLGRVEAAPTGREPFPHCIVDEVFPADFYEEIIDHWPHEQEFRSIAESGRTLAGYAERMIVPFTPEGLARLAEARRAFWAGSVADWLMGAQFRGALLGKFARELDESGFGAAPERTAGDALIVSDRTNYAIGPHTDAPHRVISLLFYLPEDAAFRRFGTSLYTPLEASFRCSGGKHHASASFRLAGTVEFRPNRLLAFPKSDRCFHGVERVDLPGIDRRLLIFDVRRV